ncbi:tyrosine-type recombinase/integrase [Lysobacter soli]|uniref:tyrosine-type recombinase/integrase n=1 Tax=Lysobacter soli TaxID=453783 RepID=UPI0037C7DCC1
MNQRPNTLDAYCRDVLVLYRCADEKSIDLDLGLASLMGLPWRHIRQLANALARTASGQIASKGTCERRLQATNSYLDFAFEYFIEAKRVRIETQRQALENLRGQKARLAKYVASKKNEAPEAKQSTSFNAAEMDIIWSVLHPESELNPFKHQAVRVRNYCMLRVAMETLARRSEVVLLEMHDINAGADPTVIIKKPAQPNASRRRDGASIKTLTRETPIRPELARALDVYIEEFRPEFVRPRVPSASLFLSARDGRRLASNTLNQICEAISQVPEVAALGKRFHPHSLRTSGSDWVDARLRESCSDSQERQALLAYLGGWSPGSKMPAYYARGSIRARLRKLLQV